MKKLQTIATVVIILVMIIMNFLILWMMIDIKVNLKNDIGTSVSKTIENVNLPKVVDDDVKTSIEKLKIGVMVEDSVNKKVDSLNLQNGKNGENGKDSVSTNTLITEKTIVQVPINGIDGKNGDSPIPRCNTVKNRWEYTYDGLTFRITLDQNNKQVKCISN